MKLKIYFLLALLWAVPALAMEKALLIRAHKQSAMQAISTYPRFIELKGKFERIGGRIKIIMEGESTLSSIGIRVHREIECYISEKCFPSDVYFNRLEQSINYYQNIWQRKMLPKGLRALCIVTLANEYKNKNQEIIAGVAALPENLKEQILFLTECNHE